MSISSAIPKRIIQTGKSHRLTLLEQAGKVNLTTLNPGFEYRYFVDADVEAFVETEFPEYKEIFYAFPYPIQRFDFFRYLAVYRLGGFYFDLDVFLARGIEELTRASCVFPFEELTLNTYLRWKLQIDWEIGNYAFGACAGHPFLRKVIENCVRAQREPSWAHPMLRVIPFPFRAEFEVLCTTGPGLISRTLAENPGLVRDLEVLFPEDVCDQRTWHRFGDYGVHLMAASWRSKGSFVHRRLALWWESRTRRRLLSESQKLGKRRVLPSSPAT